MKQRWRRALEGQHKASVPDYDRSALGIGMAHIGVGNFHRAHQAVYLDELLSLRHDQRLWASLGIELLDTATTRRIGQAFGEQDCWYTHTSMDVQGCHRSRLVGSMLGYLPGASSRDRAVRALAQPSVRIVSLTITEGGYHGEGTRLAGVFDALAGALDVRRKAGTPPFTVLSCDNLPDNGAAARGATVAAATARHPALGRWIEEHVAFPSSMVDRITPMVDDERRDRLNSLTALPDQVPVLSEDFRQWVIEDTFSNGRPAWEDVGVEFCSDVSSYVVAKQLILNGGHSMLAYPALVLGYTHIHQAAGDPLLVRLLEGFLSKDVLPGLSSVSPLSQTWLRGYAARIVERFKNPYVPDTVRRVAQDGAAKLPLFVGPTARAVLVEGDPRRIALIVACFRAYARAVPEGALDRTPAEPTLAGRDWVLLRSPDPLDALDAGPFTSWELRNHSGFVEAYLNCSNALDGDTPRAAVRQSLG